MDTILRKKKKKKNVNFFFKELFFTYHVCYIIIFIAHSGIHGVSDACLCVIAWLSSRICCTVVGNVDKCTEKNKQNNIIFYMVVISFKYVINYIFICVSTCLYIL